MYYAINMNDTLANFLRAKKLTTQQGALNAPSDLEFETGCVELKSAWQVVNASSPPPNYFTTRALVPHLTVLNGQLVVDQTAQPREVTVALLALHVVFVLQGHPEFVWSTFEHIDANGQPDTTPVAPSNLSGVSGATR